ncbi:MAG: PQQ-binding-like beta-propeller repeat protein, partial [Planctomycetaceae bacterium]|nr:PQQ-binding-like beta-propeller repeat protein [Planctomycetaceae bacterium]
MTDPKSTPEASSAAAPAAEKTEKKAKKPGWISGWIPPSLILVIGCFLLIWLQFFFQPLRGQAIINLATVVVVGLSLIELAVWFCFLSRFSRKTVVIVMLALIFSGVGFASSVQRVEFDGDMNANFIYRWEKEPELQTTQGEVTQEGEQVFEIQPTDMSQYRGSHTDGIIPGPALNRDWTAKPPRELWRTDIGAGYASMAIVGDSLITIEQRGDKEAVTCYVASTGKLKWAYEYPARFYEAMGGLGPRTTPTVAEQKVYVSGAAGDIVCLDFWTGKKIWHRNLLADLGIPNVTWGNSSSPVLHGSMLIVNPGGAVGNGLMALNKDTGETDWEGEGIFQYGPENPQNYAGYSTPIIATVDGVEQIVMFDGHGLSGHQPDNGKLLWHFGYLNEAGVNSAQPIILEDGQRIFISASYGQGSSLVKVTHTPAAEGDSAEQGTWQLEELWHDARLLRSKYASAIFFEDHIYGLDEGIMMCIEPVEGKKLWKAGRYGHGQMLFSDGCLIILAEDGKLHLVEPNPTEFRPITEMTVLPNTSRVWNPPALSRGIVYVRDHQSMAAFDLNQ